MSARRAPPAHGSGRFAGGPLRDCACPHLRMMAAPPVADDGAALGDEARVAAALRVRERLAAAEGERRAGAETRRAAAAAAADPRESVAAFAERAEQRRVSIEAELTALESDAAAAAVPNAPPPDAAAARARAEAVRATLQDFEQARPAGIDAAIRRSFIKQASVSLPFVD